MSLKTIALSVISAYFASALYAQEAVVTSIESTTENVENVDSSGLEVSDALLKKARPEGKRWYIEASAGYGIPYLATNRKSPLMEIGDKDWYQRGKKELSVKPLFGTNGGGFAANVTVGHMFNKNIGLDATITVAKHPEQLDARINITGYFAQQRTGTNALYFAPHLVTKWDNGKKFGVTGKAGLLLPFYGSTQSRAEISDKTGRMLQTLLGQPIQPMGGGIVDLTFKAKPITTYHPTLGISASIAFDYKITESLKLFAQARVAAYTISLKETKFDELFMSTKLLGIEIEELGPLKTQIKDVSEAPEFLKKIVYRKELTESSNTGRYGGKVDLTKPMDELAIRYNASSLYFNIGLTYDINRWDKRSAKKAEESEKKKVKK
ncbi:MAG: hypothetical protein M9888_00020 [Chitinophagales bacterium]|nr:hypothetical protein [Chitinophagales bacterium]